jgi:hypothetical protein
LEERFSSIFNAEEQPSYSVLLNITLKKEALLFPNVGNDIQNYTTSDPGSQ